VDWSHARLNAGDAGQQTETARLIRGLGPDMTRNLPQADLTYALKLAAYADAGIDPDKAAALARSEAEPSSPPRTSVPSLADIEFPSAGPNRRGPGAPNMPTTLPPNLRHLEPILEAAGIDIRENAEQAETMPFLDLIFNVKSRAVWDYKVNDDLLEAKDQGKVTAEDLDRLGNFHFGIVAAANGLPLSVTLQGAGMYQAFQQEGGSAREAIGGALSPSNWHDPESATRRGHTWGDNPGDSEAIMAGWNFYHGR